MRNGMQTARASSWLVWCIACSLLARPALAGDGVRLKVVRNSFIVVPVTVNGLGPFPFLLDTGADTTLIDPALAKELGLQPVDRLWLATVNGERAVPRVWLRTLAIGPATAEQVEALIAEMPSGEVKTRIRGMVGLNFLARFNYLIDFRQERIQFETGEDLAGRLLGRRLPFKADSGLIVVEAQPSPSSSELWRLKLDSGAAGLVLFREPRYPGFEPDRFSGTVEVRTHSATSTNRNGRLRNLRVGDAMFDNLPTAVIPSPQARATGDGLLPASIFQSVYVNHRHRYVIFNPQTP